VTAASRVDEAELGRRIAAGSRHLDDYTELASLLAEGERTREAIEILERTLEFPLSNLERANVSTRLGWILHDRTRQLDRALALSREALALLQGDGDAPGTLLLRGMAHSLLGHCLWSSGHAQEAAADAWRTALEVFERLIALSPEFEDIEQVWLETAQLHNALNDGDGAVPLCRRYLDRTSEPRHRVGALAALAEALRLTGRLAEAEEVVTEALASAEGLRGALPLLYSTRGLVQRGAARPADARESFEQALLALEGYPLEDEPEMAKTVRGNLAEVYAELGEHDKAVAAWRELLDWYVDDDPGRARVLLALGHACHSAGAFADARTAYATVLAAPRASDEDRVEATVWALWSAGKLDYRAGEYAAAARAFESLLQHYPEDDSDRRNALAWLGDCWYSLGDFTRARERYEEVLLSALASDAERTRAGDLADRSAARVLFAANQYAEAAHAFERVLGRLSDRDPEWCGWLLWLAACYVRMGVSGAACDCYEEVLRAPQATAEEREKARRSLDAVRGELG